MFVLTRHTRIDPSGDRPRHRLAVLTLSAAALLMPIACGGSTPPSTTSASTTPAAPTLIAAQTPPARSTKHAAHKARAARRSKSVNVGRPVSTTAPDAPPTTTSAQAPANRLAAARKKHRSESVFGPVTATDSQLVLHCLSGIGVQRVSAGRRGVWSGWDPRGNTFVYVLGPYRTAAAAEEALRTAAGTAARSGPYVVHEPIVSDPTSPVDAVVNCIAGRPYKPPAAPKRGSHGGKPGAFTF